MIPSGIAITAAITVAITVRYTVFMKSKPSRPPSIPFQNASNVVAGDGSNTGSTHLAAVANHQIATSTATPTSGSSGSSLRRVMVIRASLRAGTPRGNAP